PAELSAKLLLVPGVGLNWVSSNTRYPPAAIIVPFGILNFVGNAASSVKNQPPMSTAAAVGLYNSIASTAGGSLWVNASLMTIPAITGSGSSAPGEPPGFVLARQLEGLLG